MTTGSASSASVDAPASTLRPMPIMRDEQPEPEQPVDDRRHGRQVGDVDLDEPRHPAARAVLFEVDRRGDADRQRQQRRSAR